MSGAITATTVLAATAVAGAAYSIYSGERQASAQKDAAKKADAANMKAEQSAKKQEGQAEQAMNKSRTNAPDTSALLQAAAQPAGGSTLLTGAGGVDPNQLSLGKNTLLGG